MTPAGDVTVAVGSTVTFAGARDGRRRERQSVLLGTSGRDAGNQRPLRTLEVSPSRRPARYVGIAHRHRRSPVNDPSPPTRMITVVAASTLLTLTVTKQGTGRRYGDEQPRWHQLRQRLLSALHGRHRRGHDPYAGQRLPVRWLERGGRLRGRRRHRQSEHGLHGHVHGHRHRDRDPEGEAPAPATVPARSPAVRAASIAGLIARGLPCRHRGAADRNPTSVYVHGLDGRCRLRGWRRDDHRPAKTCKARFRR